MTLITEKQTMSWTVVTVVIVGLFLANVVYTFVVLGSGDLLSAERAGRAVGSALFNFLASGLIPVIVWLCFRFARKAARWVLASWTILLILLNLIQIGKSAA